MWYEGVERVQAEAAHLARAFAPATVVPVHFEGWEHFTETRRHVERAFAADDLTSRLQWLTPGLPEELRVPV